MKKKKGANPHRSPPKAPSGAANAQSVTLLGPKQPKSGSGVTFLLLYLFVTKEMLPLRGCKNI